MSRRTLRPLAYSVRFSRPVHLSQGAHTLVTLHNNPDSGADTLVNQL